MSRLLSLDCGGPLSWTPLVLTGLTMWFKPETLSGQDGDDTGSWTDSSGNTRHATQGTAALKPHYYSNQLNGYGCLRFVRTSGMYLTSTWTQAAGKNGQTLGLVFKVVDPSGANGVFSSYNGGSVGGGTRAMWYATGQSYLDVDGTRYLYAGTIGTSAAVVVVVYDGTQSTDATKIKYYLNGTQITDGTFYGVGSVPTSLGQRTSVQLGDASNAAAMDLFEVVEYSACLSAGDQSSLTTYLKTKYGIA